MNLINMDMNDCLSRLDTLATIERVALAAGGQITFRRFGKGAPLVLLHGGHGNWKHWAANIESLAAHHEVWLPDMPGYGDSDDLESNVDLALLVQAVCESLDTLFGESTAIDLAGFSFGGLVAATVASRRPVRRLALMGSAGHGGPRRNYGQLLNWRATSTPQERRRALRDNLAAFMLFDRENIDDTAVDIYEDACLRTRFRSKAISHSGDLAQTLGQVAAPVLLIWGGEDVTADQPELFVEKMPAHAVFRFEKLSRAGHWVQWECASQVNDLLEAWFATPGR